MAVSHDLTDRQQRYLVACFRAYQTLGGVNFKLQAGGFFNHIRAGIEAGFSDAEALDLANLLENKSLLQVRQRSGTLGQNAAVLTSAGRELARELSPPESMPDHEFKDIERLIVLTLAHASMSLAELGRIVSKVCGHEIGVQAACQGLRAAQAVDFMAIGVTDSGEATTVTLTDFGRKLGEQFWQAPLPLTERQQHILVWAFDRVKNSHTTQIDLRSTMPPGYHDIDDAVAVFAQLSELRSPTGRRLVRVKGNIVTVFSEHAAVVERMKRAQSPGDESSDAMALRKQQSENVGPKLSETHRQYAQETLHELDSTARAERRLRGEKLAEFGPREEAPAAMQRPLETKAPSPDERAPHIVVYGNLIQQHGGHMAVDQNQNVAGRDQNVSGGTQNIAGGNVATGNQVSAGRDAKVEQAESVIEKLWAWTKKLIGMG